MTSNQNFPTPPGDNSAQPGQNRRRIGFALLFFEMIFLISGQFLFQKAANSFSILPGLDTLSSLAGIRLFVHSWMMLILSPVFIFALIFYAGAVLTWMTVLQILPIVQAMPILALVFVLVPLMSFSQNHEMPPWQLIVGVFLVVFSIIVIAGDKGLRRSSPKKNDRRIS